MARHTPIRVQRNGAYWQAVWCDRTGRRRARSLGPRSKVSRRQATAKAQQLAAHFDRNPVMRDATKAPLFGHYKERYVEQRKGKLASLWMHELALRRFIESGSVSEDARLDQITRAQASDFVQWLERRGLQHNTVAKHVRCLKAFFNAAVKELADICVVPNPLGVTP